MQEQYETQQRRKTAWRAWIKDTWALNSKKSYQLVKGKFVEPFTCLQSEGQIINDRHHIDQLLQQAWNPIFAKYPTEENKASEYRHSFYPHDSSSPAFSFPDLTLEDIRYVLSKKLKNNTATGLDGWRPSEIKQLPDCLLLALLDIFGLCETKGYFPSSFYYSYTTLIPKGLLRTPLSLRPITVLPVPYRIYASLRCQTLLKWQNSWIHPSQFAFCKGRSTTSLNSHLSFDLLQRFHSYGSFAGIQFDFAKCFDSIPYSVIWDTLSYHGCDANFILLLRHLYTNMHTVGVFVMQDVSVHFGMLQMAFYKATPWAVLSLIASFALYFVSYLLFLDSLSTPLLMTLLSFLLLGIHCIKLIKV